jgi:hypothetical protein
MAMSLAALEILEEAQLPSAHARAIVRALEADSSARLESLATKTDLALLKGELIAFKGEIKGDLAALKGNLRGELVRWIFAVMTGQTAVLTGIMYFLLNQMRD